MDSYGRLIAVIAVLIVAAFAASIGSTPRTVGSPTIAAVSVSRPPVVAPDASAPREAKTSGATPATAAPANQRVRRTLAQLLNGTDARAGRITVRRLTLVRQTLLDGGPASVDEIVRALRSGIDRTTGQPFTVGPDGHLEHWPTVRIFLLDVLGGLDLRMAGEYALELLGQSDAPDEVAIALRNYAWAEVAANNGDMTEAARAVLRDHASRLLDRAQGLAMPTAGHLEAFDAIVYTNSSDFAPDLARLTSPDANRAVAYASFIALHRLVERDAVATLGELGNNLALLDDRPDMRAGLFARADVRDDAQRAALEAYLLSSHPNDRELSVFAGLFPNLNDIASNNLLTKSERPSLSDARRRVEASLLVVEAWRNDDRFSHLHPRLDEALARLRAMLPHTS